MRALVLLALGLLAACGAQVRACPAVGMLVGIGVDVAPPVAERVDSLSLFACWDGSCRTYPVRLFPSTTVTGSTCTGPGPANQCSAQTGATGGKHGFAEIPDLPAAPIDVTLSGFTLRVTPKLSYPNGPDCGGGGPQANLVVDGTGVRPGP
jgi:hypothetical protein